MQTPTPRFSEGWSAQDILKPGIYFSYHCSTKSLKVSNLCMTLYSVKSLTFKKLWDFMLFKFQWHTE